MLSAIIVPGLPMCLWVSGPDAGIGDEPKTATGFLDFVSGPVVTLVGSAAGVGFASRSAGSRQARGGTVAGVRACH